MINMLVTFHNAIIIHNNYSSRWSKVVDVTNEKVKGLRQGKLRILEIIEAGMQLIIRGFRRKK